MWPQYAVSDQQVIQDIDGCEGRVSEQVNTQLQKLASRGAVVPACVLARYKAVMPQCDGFVSCSSLLVLSGLQLNPLENGDRFPRAELQFWGNLTNDGLTNSSPLFNLPLGDD